MEHVDLSRNFGGKRIIENSLLEHQQAKAVDGVPLIRFGVSAMYHMGRDGSVVADIRIFMRR